MKVILFFLILLVPCFGFAQSMDEKYAIYSDHLRAINKGYLEHTKENCAFVVMVSAEYYNGLDDVADAVKDWKTYARNINDEAVKASLNLMWWHAPDSLKKDTLWFPLADRLVKSMKKGYYIKNNFATYLHITMLTYNDYTRYYDGRSYDWNLFKANFGAYSELVDFSEVVSDGRRAIFYCARRCQSLCGSGSLVFYFKDSSGWHKAGEWTLWMS